MHPLPRAMRRRLASTRASIGRRPRLFGAAGLVVLVVLIGAGRLAAVAAQPPAPTSTSPSFTVQSGWTLVELERRLAAGDISAITATPPSATNPAGELLVRTRDGQVVGVDLAVSAPDAVSALTSLGYGNLLTTEAAAIARPAGGTPTPAWVTVGLPVLLLILALAVGWRLWRRNQASRHGGDSTFMTILPPDSTVRGGASRSAIAADG
ncbi:MAG: hypothetical protein QOF49_1175, partial [Chloroflexota bacterium]|nr:hypothetical protein [Chloroflexota bacterium]